MKTSTSPMRTLFHGANHQVLSYAVGVNLIGLAVVAAALTSPVARPVPMTLCALVFFGGESLSLRTLTSKGRVSMASLVHLAAVPVLPLSVIVPAAWMARVSANLLVQRQSWYKAFFNAAQVAVAVAAAAALYGALGNQERDIVSGTFPFGFLPSILVASIVYYVVNVSLVSTVIALGVGTSAWQAWRENFGYGFEIVSSVALFLLAPVMTLTFEHWGIAGILVFLLPVAFIRDANRRFIDLEKAQRALVASERLAAKGEMAASVAHEINNYLSVLSGNLQLLDRTPDEGQREQRMVTMKKQVDAMASLSRGLMQFSRLESHPSRTDLCRLARNTIDFLSPQNRMDHVTVTSELDPRVGELMVDGAQIEQLLMNLILNAADAMKDQERPCLVHVQVRWVQSKHRAEIVVEDSGPGIPEKDRARIFDPHFSTKPDGHGFGLSTVFRIVNNHHGRITVDASPSGGTRFRIELEERRAPVKIAA